MDVKIEDVKVEGYDTNPFIKKAFNCECVAAQKHSIAKNLDDHLDYKNAISPVVIDYVEKMKGFKAEKSQDYIEKMKEFKRKSNFDKLSNLVHQFDGLKITNSNTLKIIKESRAQEKHILHVNIYCNNIFYKTFLSIQEYTNNKFNYIKTDGKYCCDSIDELMTKVAEEISTIYEGEV